MSGAIILRRTRLNGVYRDNFTCYTNPKLEYYPYSAVILYIWG